MSRHSATIAWERAGAVFTDQRYSRAHRWRFDGGLELPASSSPQLVPLPLSDAAAVDPEEAFVASLASCHMLWFLSLAAESGHVVEGYLDEAVGELGRNAEGVLAITRVTLRPQVRFAAAAAGGAAPPDEAGLHALHEAAHEACFLAASVRCELRCEPLHEAAR